MSTVTAIKRISKMHYEGIVELINRETEKLGSASKVATKCAVSNATISNMVNGKWELVRPNMWATVATALDWRPAKAWVRVETNTMKLHHQVFADAKAESMWQIICDPAGMGKTTSAKTFAAREFQDTFYLECDEWTRGHFLKKLAQSLGIPTNTAHNYYELLEEITAFLKKKAATGSKVLVILDQADKLYDQAVRTLIPIFNDTEDKCAVVLIGVEHLRKRINRNVKNAQCGWDEVASRFGRKYIGAAGADRSDVANICHANGIEDAETIKLIWGELWDMEKARTTINGKDTRVIRDMRRLKRCIQRELLLKAEMPIEAEAPQEAEAVAA